MRKSCGFVLIFYVIVQLKRWVLCLIYAIT
nr:MAG TPA: hypothetical protein [Caudoviricetes sp.]